MSVKILWATQTNTVTPTRIGELFFQAFRAKFVHFHFTPTEAQTSADLLGEYILTFHRRDLIIVEQDGQINGCLLVNHGGKTTGRRAFTHRMQQTLPRHIQLKMQLFRRLLAHKVDANTTVIDFIAVASDHRQQGLGEAMLRFCQDHFQRLGISIVTSNQPAVTLVEHRHFQVEQQHHNKLVKPYLGFSRWADWVWVQN